MAKRVAFLAMLILGGWLPAASATAAEASAKEVEDFANQMIAELKKLNDAGFELGTKIGPALKEEKVDQEAARTSYGKALIVHAKVERTLRTMKIPDHPAAVKFHQAFLEFGDQQGKMTRHLIGELMDILDDGRLTPAEIKTRVTDVMQRVEKSEKKQIETVNKAYMEMKAAIGAK